MPAVEYKDVDVLTAAKRRISLVFDRFKNVVVSISSGKDSSVLYHLCLDEAAQRGRKVTAFFLDQEAEYKSTVEVIGRMMRHPLVDPLWVQVPLQMTNATSHVDYWLHAWGPGEPWMREKDPIAVHEIQGRPPKRFYAFFPWLEAQATEPTAYMIGLRSKESFNRYRAVSGKPGHDGLVWSTKTKSPHAFRFYPLYDWTFGDVWKYIWDHEVPYNEHYNRMFAKYGQNISTMRVSNLIHEKSFRCLVDLHEFEPRTYEKLIRRLGGVHCAALYGREEHVYDAKALPAGFPTWRAYRDYLVETTPLDRIERFRKRFARQADDEETCRQQAKQVLLNDWENSVPVASPQGSRRKRLRERWWDEL